MKVQKPSSLFWSWGAYVFLPMNIVIGSILAGKKANISELILSSMLALIIMMCLSYPAIQLSTKYRLNYSEAINKFFNNMFVKKILIIIVPIINIGWFSIQTNLFMDIINNYFTMNKYIYLLLIIGVSYFFVIGVSLFNYVWLKKAGAFGMMFMTIVFLLNIKQGISIHHGSIDISNLITFTLLILGTWIFSLVTCVMDLTKYTIDGKKSFIYILMATFVANNLLIYLGYILNYSIFEFTSVSLLNLIAIIVAIWTSNDSNFFSTTKALETLNFNSIKVKICLPLISCFISIIIKGTFEDYIVSWLSLMSWIGVPFSIIWWVIFLKDTKEEKLNVYNIRRS